MLIKKRQTLIPSTTIPNEGNNLIRWPEIKKAHKRPESTFLILTKSNHSGLYVLKDQ